MINVVAIILARGGSKGIPGKNIINFCGKPLIVWTIEQLHYTKGIKSIWVSSDSEEIISIGRANGAEFIRRPAEISGDSATSESGWLHALEIVENKMGTVDIILAPQVTSPLRESQDMERGLNAFQEQQCDSMFSCSIVEDLLFWKKEPDESMRSANYDYKDRGRRQERTKQYIENGSFYLFRSAVLKQYNNRLGGKIGVVPMALWKMFEIDSMDDLKLCEVLMREFLMNRNEER
jgi:N-acylneuraminate cytidylyltransferase